MLLLQEFPIAVEAPQATAVFEPAPQVQQPPSITRRTLGPGDVLYRGGEPRGVLYLIEDGALSLHMEGHEGDTWLAGYAGPGDIVGLGFLERHVTTAEAELPTIVREITEDEARELADTDAALDTALCEAIEREFLWLRERAVASGLDKPLTRLASLLLAVKEAAVREGGGGAMVAGGVTCGFVAERLQMSLDELAAALVELEQRGLVAAAAEGLQLTDTEGLEALAAQ